MRRVSGRAAQRHSARTHSWVILATHGARGDVRWRRRSKKYQNGKRSGKQAGVASTDQFSRALVGFLVILLRRHMQGGPNALRQPSYGRRGEPRLFRNRPPHPQPQTLRSCPSPRWNPRGPTTWPGHPRQTRRMTYPRPHENRVVLMGRLWPHMQLMNLEPKNSHEYKICQQIEHIS